MSQPATPPSDSSDTIGSPDTSARERAFASRLARAWRDTVGAFATDEGETRNLMRRLVEFGALSREEASRTLIDMRMRIEDNRAQLDRRVEQSLRHALARWNAPSPSEISVLQKRIAELEARVQRLDPQ